MKHSTDMNPARRLLPLIFALVGLASMGISQNNLEARFTHRFLVDPDCVQPQDINILQLTNLSSSAEARTTWHTDQPKFAHIMPGLNGSAILSFDILNARIPEQINVTLVLTDSQGNKDSVTNTIQLNMHYAPIVRIAEGLSHTNCVGNEITLHNKTFSIDGTQLTHYLWDFGDQSTSTNQDPTHTYHNPGNYSVRLTVTDNQGCSGGNHPTAPPITLRIKPEGACN